LNFDIHLSFACLPAGRDFDIWILLYILSFNSIASEINPMT